ncbi:hypothetical protein GCM10023187_32150 [Nibrella viscosa]|uniref:Curli production assembly/transport component CsgG n=1 Tax=Nibrella viscosa TaxID=1084524 RepID=A0ABP8KKC8_9BACT
MKLLFTLAGWLFLSPLAFAQVSSQPIVSVFPFRGHYSERVTSSVFAGLTGSKRVKMVDPTILHEILQQQKVVLNENVNQETTIQIGKLAGAQFMISGEVTALNFSNQQLGNTVYHNCNVEAKLQLTDIESGTSEFVALQGSSSSSTGDRENLVNIAMNSLTNKAENFARRKFPAVMQILEILEQNDKKGIVLFRVEGEGLTAKTSGGSDFLPLPLPLPDFNGRTRIIITNQRVVVRPDGSKRIVQEEVAFAKIKKVEDGGTALCTITEGGKKLQELWDRQARLMLKTTN